MAPDIFRDSALGQLINWATRGRCLPYADQKPDYVVPAHLIARPAGASSSSYPPLSRPSATTTARQSAEITFVEAITLSDGVDRGTGEEAAVESGLANADKQASSKAPSTTGEAYPYLVDWEENDPDNPRNWSAKKRHFVAGLVVYYSFAVYIGSVIYTASIPGLTEQFDIGLVAATAGLTLFVAGYGVGPMLLSPMQEMPAWGRNPVYLAGLILFVIFQIPCILAKNLATILVFRFLSGFVGSPSLATGGATLGDIYPPNHIAVAIGAWAFGGLSGPIFG
ncbi:hypothetical protein JCM8097_001130 [Rhodosporidiobolus ruineniae]